VEILQLTWAWEELFSLMVNWMENPQKPHPVATQRRLSTAWAMLVRYTHTHTHTRSNLQTYKLTQAAMKYDHSTLIQCDEGSSQSNTTINERCFILTKYYWIVTCFMRIIVLLIISASCSLFSFICFFISSDVLVALGIPGWICLQTVI